MSIKTSFNYYSYSGSHHGALFIQVLVLRFNDGIFHKLVHSFGQMVPPVGVT